MFERTYSSRKFCSVNCRQAHYRENRKEYYGRIREYWNEYKIQQGCADCGYSLYACALQFDHVRGDKEFSISFGITSGFPEEKIEQEVLKCEIRCANCHAVRHWVEYERSIHR